MVVWTPRARDDLKAIHDYIAQDAPINAKQVTRDILAKAASIADLPPLSCKVVRELTRDQHPFLAHYLPFKRPTNLYHYPRS